VYLKLVLILVSLLIVLRLNFSFIFGFCCAVYWQVFALHCWARFLVTSDSYSLQCFWLLVFFSGFIEFSRFLASLVISKKEKPSLCNSLVLYGCFLFGFFIHAVLRVKFIELGYSCLNLRAWQSFSLCFKGQS